MRKVCSKCGEEKNVVEFYWRNKSKGYRSSWCKNCMAEYQQDNRDLCNERSRNWRKDNPEYNKQWRKDNPEYNKQYHRDNREQISEYNNQWQKDNREHLTEYKKQYAINNKDIVNAQGAIKRARKINQTPIDANMTEILHTYSICSYMNSISIGCKWEVDHIHPISKGGLHHQDNLQILDSIANRRKSNKLIGETK